MGYACSFERELGVVMFANKAFVDVIEEKYMNTSTEIAGRLKLLFVMLIEIEAQMEELGQQIAEKGQFINLDDEISHLAVIKGQQQQVLTEIRVLNKEFWKYWGVNHTDRELSDATQ